MLSVVYGVVCVYVLSDVSVWLVMPAFEQREPVVVFQRLLVPMLISFHIHAP